MIPCASRSAPFAWERTAAGPWLTGGLGTTGRAKIGTLLIEEAAEDELRAFCNLTARRTPRSGEVAWALRRFELGCERPNAFEALTDHLLALRALLEPEGPQSGRLAGRVAALCAIPEQRLEVTQRVAHAAVFERSIISGLAPADGGVEKLLAEMTNHLRALLRDVLCGHLDADLRAVADQLLTQIRRRGLTTGVGPPARSRRARAGTSPRSAARRAPKAARPFRCRVLRRCAGRAPGGRVAPEIPPGRCSSLRAGPASQRRGSAARPSRRSVRSAGS